LPMKPKTSARLRQRYPIWRSSPTIGGTGSSRSAGALLRGD